MVVTLATFLVLEPIAQRPEYHEFVDGRAMLGIPNAMNVLSSSLFLIVGLGGVGLLLASMRRCGWGPRRLLYLLFFTSFGLIAFGSSYYHLSPSNETLVWDRLPIALALMALLGTVISELLSARFALKLTPALLVVGVFSVLYWHYTEQVGHGDLRLYGLVHFLPFLLIVLMLWFYDLPRGYSKPIISGLGLYALAKIFEVLDAVTFEILVAASGHTLKHLFAAGAGFAVLRMVYRRRDVTFGHRESKLSSL
jgi:hypothetical protein